MPTLGAHPVLRLLLAGLQASACSVPLAFPLALSTSSKDFPKWGVLVLHPLTDVSELSHSGPAKGNMTVWSCH